MSIRIQIVACILKTREPLVVECNHEAVDKELRMFGTFPDDLAQMRSLSRISQVVSFPYKLELQVPIGLVASFCSPIIDVAKAPQDGQYVSY